MKEELLKIGEAIGFVRAISPAELQSIAERQAREALIKIIKPCPDVLDNAAETTRIAVNNVDSLPVTGAPAQNLYNKQQGWQ